MPRPNKSWLRHCRCIQQSCLEGEQTSLAAELQCAQKGKMTYPWTNAVPCPTPDLPHGPICNIFHWQHSDSQRETFSSVLRGERFHSIPQLPFGVTSQLFWVSKSSNKLTRYTTDLSNKTCSESICEGRQRMDRFKYLQLTSGCTTGNKFHVVSEVQKGRQSVRVLSKHPLDFISEDCS